MHGTLINISGIDGCGKTMQVRMLEAWFALQKKKTLIVKAYDDTAKLACRQFMDTWSDDTAIMFLFQALHAQQYAVTAEALRQGDVVIADRWDESYTAYHQNFGFLSERKRLRDHLNKIAFRDLEPHIGFIIEVSPDIARKRRSSRGKIERFEDRSDEYYETVQQTYLEIARNRDWIVLNGRKTPDTIHAEIVEAIRARGIKF